MKRTALLSIACWILAAYGALRVADLPIDSHELCGPWGCLPPVQALAAMHLLWCVLLFPVVLWMLTNLNFHLLSALGITVMAASGVALACLVGSDLPQWLEMVPPSLQGYWGRRILYDLAIRTDLPLVQLFLAGGVCWFKSRVVKRANSNRVGKQAKDGEAEMEVTTPATSAR